MRSLPFAALVPLHGDGRQDRFSLRNGQVPALRAPTDFQGAWRGGGDSGKIAWEQDVFERSTKPETDPMEGSHRVYRRILGRLPRYGAPSGNLLDLGCAAGFGLGVAAKMGFQPCGVDVSRTIVNYVRNDLGIPAYQTVGEAVADRGLFDVVVCSETLYVMRDAFAAMVSIRDAMKPQGTLCLKITANRAFLLSVARLLARARGRSLVLREGERLHSYTGQGFYVSNANSLRLLVERAGFTVLGVHNDGFLPPKGKGFGSAFRRAAGMAGLALTTATSILTLGRVKTGAHITLYARRT